MAKDEKRSLINSIKSKNVNEAKKLTEKIEASVKTDVIEFNLLEKPHFHQNPEKIFLVPVLCSDGKVEFWHPNDIEAVFGSDKIEADAGKLSKQNEVPQENISIFSEEQSLVFKEALIPNPDNELSASSGQEVVPSGNCYPSDTI